MDGGRWRRDREERWLDAYRDGELGPVRSWWLERRIARSSELRDRLQDARALGELVRSVEADDQVEASEAPLNLWSEIGPGLSAIDRELAARRAARPGFAEVLRGLGRTQTLTAMAAAALLLLTLFGGLLESAFEGLPMAPTLSAEQGALRFLDTSGRPVWVSEDQEGTTIIWLMETPAGA